jgi:hypothetical protein
MSDERKSMKGKYFKEMVQKFNKQFGNLLTSGEIDKILSNPENQGQTFDAVIASIHAKAIEQLSPKESAELRQMLDAANAEKNTLKEQLEDTFRLIPTINERVHMLNATEFKQTPEFEQAVSNTLGPRALEYLNKENG